MNQAEELIRSKDSRGLKNLLKKDHSLADQKTEQGISLLQYAAYCRNIEAVRVLRKYVLTLDVFEAASIDDMGTVATLCEKHHELVGAVSTDGFTPLGLASFFGHGEIVRLLLHHGADPNKASENSFHVAPLHSACAFSHNDIAEILIRAGAEVNSRQAGGFTPLHSAAHNGATDLAKLLVEHGADLNATTEDGKTPQFMAEEGNHTETAEYLRNPGGNKL